MAWAANAGFQLLAEFLNFAQGVLAFANLNQFVPVGLTAILDRFLAHATIVQMAGNSYRLRPRATAEPT